MNNLSGLLYRRCGKCRWWDRNEGDSPETISGGYCKRFDREMSNQGHCDGWAGKAVEAA